jgi:hypothetical protein
MCLNQWEVRFHGNLRVLCDHDSNPCQAIGSSVEIVFDTIKPVDFEKFLIVYYLGIFPIVA